MAWSWGQYKHHVSCEVWRDRDAKMKGEWQQSQECQALQQLCSFPKNIFHEKTKAFTLPLREWFGLLIGAERPFMNRLRFSFGLSSHIVFISEPEIYTQWTLMEQNVSSLQFTFASAVFLYLLNLNYVFSRPKKKKKNAFLTLMHASP